ncbi:MAG: heavy metal translocating P-type ATPase metal-binding domain-containing protein [Cyclobacteriaceae bacterium]
MISGNSTDTASESICYHCGDKCIDLITEGDKNFCCHGCKTVYELLEAHDLSTYYELNSAPGSSQNLEKTDFSYLENEEIAARLLDFDSESIGRITLFLPSIHCSSCIWLLENLPALFDGLVSSQVNFVKKQASVTFRKEKLTLRQVAELVSKIGYTPIISLDDQREKVKKRNPLVVKLAVAGFCFGNSMLISIPGYLDTGSEITAELRSLFGLVNVVLMLPVLFFAAGDYFKTAFLSLRQKRISIDVPVALGISILFIQTLQEIITGSGSGYADSLTGLVFFLLIGKWYQDKTYQALSFERTFKSFFPIAVNRITIEGDEFVPIEQIRVKDRIRIRNGEVIPADGILLKGNAQIDYSFVTGESLPEKVAPNRKIFAGGRQKGAAIELEVAKEVSSGYLTELWNHTDFKKADESGLQNIINRISGVFTVVILLIAVVASASWALIDSSEMWKVGTSVMIIACPCALALALPFAYGHALRYLGRSKFYLKNAEIIEKIARAEQIVFDKTGTLTQNDSLELSYAGQQLTPIELSILKTACANSMHPYSKLLEKHLVTFTTDDIQPGFDREACEFKETEGKGIVASVNGRAIKIGSAGFLGVSVSESKESQVHVAIDGVYKGFFKIKSAYRSGIFSMLERLKKQFKLYLLSGDNSFEKDRLYPYFRQLSFRQSPEDKFLATRKLKREGSLIMIGDGLNDAGALKLADVGVAVTDDIHQFSPACDAIISGSELCRFDELIGFCYYAYQVVKLALVISIGYNLVGLYFAVTAQLTPILSAILMPVSSVSVVGIITLLIRWKASKLLRKPK